MVDVGGKPVLERIANYLENLGVKRIIVNLHSHPEVVIKSFGQRFLYLYEPIPMGEFSTVVLVRGWFPMENIILVNGDTFTDLDFRKLPFGRYCVNGVPMGVSKIGRGEPYKDVEVKCWWQDMGTQEGLKIARKKYG
jgi:dTDP-glucose pyrophosphorylase